MFALPGAAHALVACTAAQVSSQDPSCPSGTGACNISRTFDVGDGCTLDFGTRAVTVLASGKIDIASNAVTITAGSFTVAPGGRVEGRGPMPAPRDRGGLLTITTTGAFNVQRSGTSKGVVDLSGDTKGGTFKVIAGGPITVSGDVLCNNLTPRGGNGSISLHSDGDITTGSLSTIAANGGEASSGGFIDINGKGKVDLGANLAATGGDGGVIDVQAGGEAIVRGMSAFGQGDAGSGGCASVFATRVQMLGAVNLNGTGSTTQSGGGCGGYIDIDARFGDVSLAAPISSESGFPDGGGGGIGVVARGSITHAVSAPLSVQGNGGQSCGGEISLEADFDVTSGGLMNASGGFGGNLIDVVGGRNVVLNGMVNVAGRDSGGFGGSATIIGGDRGQGNVNVNSSIDARGGACGTLTGCGLGGFIEIIGCDVTVASSAALDSSGPDAGDNLVTAREKLTVHGILDATATMDPGENRLQHPTRVAPTINTANVRPAPVVAALATCTALPPTNCLVPCPTCGNGMVEFPETCDTSGTPVNCDGCSNFCRVQNCNDGSLCTSDSCDVTLGCRNDPVADGTSCTDNNVCNGVEQCSFGLCRATTPALNCNDNKQCTTDSCHPTLGCQNPASAPGTPCNDGNICTANDVCNASMVCAGQPGPCLPTTTSLPTPTTSTTSTSSTSSTSSSAPTPTTSSTSVPTPTTSSTSTPTPTTSSTSTPTPTTSSTSTPTPTTSSTSSPVPTSTSTSVPGATTSSTSTPPPTTTTTSSPVPTTSTSVPGASTSTSVPGATTTSTSRPASSTTSTSLPGGCVPANCDDGNACTTDVCQGATCVHRRDGFDAVACELGVLQNEPANLCQPDPIYKKLARAIGLKSTKARTLIGKAENNTKTGQNLLERAGKQLTGLRNRIAKAGDRGRITPACRAKLDALLAERLTLVQGLGTP